MRIAFSVIVILHGLIHLIGVAKAFGFANPPPLVQDISRPMGLLWLSAGLAMIGSALSPARWFWLIGACAVILSSAVIFSAWHEAKFGMIANLIVLVGVGYSFASVGPISLQAEYHRNRASILTNPGVPPAVTEADLKPLPAAVQRYLRVTGSVGQARILNFRARWLGRIRASASEPWMSFQAEQVNTFGPIPARLFSMDATMKHLPVDIYHRFITDSATFRVRLLSLFSLVDAKGAVMDKSETVTLLNDLCVLAPAALIDPALRWESSDGNSADVAFTRGAYTVRATLHFSDTGELIDFVSDDRARAASDSKSFRAERWSTPLREYRTFGVRRVATYGQAVTHAPEGAFAYGEFTLQQIEYNVSVKVNE